MNQLYLGEMIKTFEHLHCYAPDQVATHVTKLQSLNVAVKVNVEHLCHNQIVLAEKEGIVYLEQSMLVRFASQNLAKEPCL